MDQDASASTRPQPFTLVVCTSPCGAGAPSAVMTRLRRAVRECPHGVLVVTGCLRQVLHCQGAAHGVYGVVQPCGVDRAPSGAPVRIGPLSTEEDAVAVAAWLSTGMPDDGTLPRTLRAAPSPRRAAFLN